MSMSRIRSTAAKRRQQILTLLLVLFAGAVIALIVRNTKPPKGFSKGWRACDVNKELECGFIRCAGCARFVSRRSEQFTQRSSRLLQRFLWQHRHCGRKAARNRRETACGYPVHQPWCVAVSSRRQYSDLLLTRMTCPGGPGGSGVSFANAIAKPVRM